MGPCIGKTQTINKNANKRHSNASQNIQITSLGAIIEQKEMIFRKNLGRRRSSEDYKR